MSKSVDVERLRASTPWRVFRAVGSALLVIIAMILAYGYAPEPQEFHLPSLIPLCTFFFLVYLVITIALLRRVKRREHLTFPGMMLLTVLVVFFVLSFSWIYRVLELENPQSFSEPFTDVSAIYFTMAVLSTVGFGDIRPLDDLSRAVVTLQMVLGVGLLAASISMVTRSTERIIDHPHSPTADSLVVDPDSAYESSGADVHRSQDRGA